MAPDPSPGLVAVHALRDALITQGPGVRWRARRVVEQAQIARCVALQAESLVNRGAEADMELVTRRLTVGAGRATDVLVTVEAAGACLGFVWTSLRTLRGPDGDTLVCHLDSIVLTRAARGQGLGGELMAHLEDGARGAGFAAVSLNSMADNHRVAGFYTRLGYDVVGLDLEKALTRAGPPPPEPGVPWRPPPGARLDRAPPYTGPLRDAFEPGPDGQPPSASERFERLDGRVGASEASVRAVVAEVEHAARARGAERAFLTIWAPGSPLARVLHDLGYRVGRHKWWKGLPEGRPGAIA